MSPSPKVLIERWIREVWNEQRGSTIYEMMHPDCRARFEGKDESLTRDEFHAYNKAFLNAIPDIHVEILSIVAEDNKAVLSWRATGTHLGPGFGIPPSGKHVDFTGMSLYEFENGLIVGGWDRWNRGELVASMMQVRIEELHSRIGLTKRQAQVALLMADRLTYAEIASELGITPNTSRRHCEKVLSKLGIHSRHEVAQALGKIPGSVLNRHGSDAS
jgi:steroid delta-isomerase-like uncharacterized protein